MKRDDIIKDYKIIEEIGRGGMATVYRAVHLSLNKEVAIKILSEEFTANSNIRKRFIAEARSLFSLSHRNLTKVTDLIDTDNVVAIVLEYIDGVSLKQYINDNKPLSNNKIKELFSQMLDSVSYIHANGYVHRDIKPSNFMLTKSGTVKLLDFGIAKNMDTSSAEYTMTGTSQMMGTPMYMSPEQVRSTKDISLQTDIYSLGVVLWNLVTGIKPYDQNTLSIPEIQVSILKENLTLTNTIFDATIQKATDKKVENRFNNCDEFKKLLLKNTEVPQNEKEEDDKTIIESVIVQDDKTLIDNKSEISEKDGEKYFDKRVEDKYQGYDPSNPSDPISTIPRGKTPNSELYSSAWESLEGQWGISIGFILLYMVFLVIVKFTIGMLALDILVSAPLAVGSALFFINVSRKSNPQIEDMFKGFNSYGASLGSSLLVGLIVFGGMILLIIPGIIWLIQYSMAPYIIAEDPNCGGNESLIRSRKMMYGHKAKMFRFMLRAMGILLLCCLTLGIGFLWGAPWMATASARFYDDIK
jgi:serine/threonine protein kinase